MSIFKQLALKVFFNTFKIHDLHLDDPTFYLSKLFEYLKVKYWIKQSIHSKIKFADKVLSLLFSYKKQAR